MRQKPEILIEQKAGGKPGVMRQILASAAFYAIFYKGQPINVVEFNLLNSKNHKYPRSAFSNPGHALVLCRKLNHYFKCTDFEVFALTMDGGIKVVERE